MLTPLAPPPAAHLLIAKPDVGVSTRFVYENLHADTLRHHPDIDGMVKAIGEGNLEGITSRMENVLETVTIREYPVIRDIKETMKEARALNALMSGSGPAVFGVFDTAEAAQAAYEKVRETDLAKRLFVTEFV